MKQTKAVSLPVERTAVDSLFLRAKVTLPAAFFLALSMSAMGCTSAPPGGADDSQTEADRNAVTLTPTSGKGEVDLSWTTSLNGVGQFVVKRGTSSTSLTDLATLSSSTLSYQDKTVTPNTTYYYQVIATKGSVNYGSPIVPILFASSSKCGDAVCDDAETCTSCSADCGLCAGSCVNAGASWQSSAVAAQTGSFSAEFDATPGAANIDAVTGLSAGAATWYTDLAAIVRFNSQGTIDARNGGDYAAATSIPYTAGTSYHFRLALNVATRTYSAFVTPEGGSETVIGSNFAFRTEQAAVTSLGNWSTYDDIGTHTVCNFTISTPNTCTPNCAGKQCGDDGCGGSCGTCASGQSCASNQCVATTPTTGGNWYVRPGGAGGKTGANWTNATDLSGVPWASVQPGDTIWLAGGVYHGALAFGKSGTAGKPITVRRVLSSDAVAGDPDFSASFDSLVHLDPSVNFNAKSFVTLDGGVDDGILINMPSGTLGAVNWGPRDGVTNVPSDSVQLKHVKIVGPGWGCFYGYAIFANYNKQTIKNPLISHCTIDGTVEGIDIEDWQDGVVEYTKILNIGDGPTCTSQHTDVMYVWSATNLTLRYNYTQNSFSQAIVFYWGNVSGITIYGNVFDRGPLGEGSLIEVTPSGGNNNSGYGDFHIFNNTFIGWGPSTGGTAIMFDPAANGTGFRSSEVYNNIFWNSSNSNHGIGVSDYNGYNDNSGGFGFAGELHSVSLAADALVSPSTGNFHVSDKTGAGYARGKGTNLSSVCSKWPSLCVDPDGNQRPQTGGWDLGAYQHP
jgi:hypothetical protein